MITTAEEYYRALFRVQDDNPPTLALLPHAETTYKVDLNKRTIETPEFLSVARDHKAENIYFEVDRFCDYMDLSTCCCIVQYEAGEGETRRSGIYPVPFYDITTPNNRREIENQGQDIPEGGETTETDNPVLYIKDKMLVPWCLDGAATAYPGPITYSLQFYRLNIDGTKFVYNMNTTPVTSEILYGMDVVKENYNGAFDIEPDEYQKILARVVALEGTFDIKWMDMF
jgi:hypothetical protein